MLEKFIDIRLLFYQANKYSWTDLFVIDKWVMIK